MVDAWVGVYKRDEMCPMEGGSCLSDGVQEDLQRALGVESVENAAVIEDISGKITQFLTLHPSLSLIHAQSVKEATEILHAWYGPRHSLRQPTPTDESTDDEWSEYFGGALKVQQERMLSPRYSMLFQRKDGNYSVVGPRDTMLALFGWNATISDDKSVPINLKYKVELDRMSFLRVHHAVDVAEKDHEPPLPRK